MSWYYYKPYVSVAQRRANAAREVAKRQKKGETVSPVIIDGRKIVTTFWGSAWCKNLESYSDFCNRLPRGRTYVRNGSVVHLQIEPRKITALVSGSELYEVTVAITALPGASWQAVKRQCAGQIGSLVELLQGRLSKSVMDIVTRRDGGLFPKPREIKMSCTCPDWAGMCKHVAAVLYGVGARLDQQPELLFRLREVDHLELIAEAVVSAPVGRASARRKKTIASSDLANVFGIELADSAASETIVSRADELAKTMRSKSTAGPKPVSRPRKVRSPTAAAGSTTTESTSVSGVRPRKRKNDGTTRRASMGATTSNRKVSRRGRKTAVKIAAAKGTGSR
jgi:uncharacterized Zn finger protein